jgi:hypothetical protein
MNLVRISLETPHPMHAHFDTRSRTKGPEPQQREPVTGEVSMYLRSVSAKRPHAILDPLWHSSTRLRYSVMDFITAKRLIFAAGAVRVGRVSFEHSTASGIVP